MANRTPGRRVEAAVAPASPSQAPLRRLFTTAALAAVVIASIPAVAEARPVKAIWGPHQFHAGHAECGGGGPCSAFPVYRQLGVDVYQFQIQWDDVAPTRPANPRNPADPAYDWPSSVDSIVAQARAHRIGLAALVKGTPAWANGGRSSAWAPGKPRLFADFMFAASRRYPTIRKWMIWGEPTRRDNFLPQGRRGVRRYARMLDAAFGALKRARRSNVVIGGMTLNGGDKIKTPRFLKLLRLPNGKPPRMNLYGHNPFDRRFPNIRKQPIRDFRGLPDVDTLWREVSRAYQRRNGRWARKRSQRPRKLWLAEWLVQSDHDSDIFDWHVSRKKQAVYLRAGYRLARRAKYVKALGWFRLDDEPNSATSAAWGLMTYSGARKPAFKAYRFLP